LLTGYDSLFGAGQLLTLFKYDTDTLRVLIAHMHTTADDYLKATFQFTLPAGVVLDYYTNSGIFLSSATGPYILDPTDPNALVDDPYFEVNLTDVEFQPGSISYWAGMWRLQDIAALDEVDVTVIVEDGTTASSTQTITW
jgi:hypothetical protein